MHDVVTGREIQVLELLMRSLTNKEISAALRIGERTAKFHVSNILSKLHVEDRRGLLPDASCSCRKARRDCRQSAARGQKNEQIWSLGWPGCAAGMEPRGACFPLASPWRR